MPLVNRVVGGVVVVVAVAAETFTSNSASSLKPEPSAMSRELSMGASTQRHPDPGSAGSMIANSRPTAVEMGIAGFTYVGGSTRPGMLDSAGIWSELDDVPLEQPTRSAKSPMATTTVRRRRFGVATQLCEV